MADNTIEDINTTDRISELPRNLIDSIVERLTICESARTSILSTKWRYIWSTLPQLVLDKQFFDGIIRNVPWSSVEFVRTINNILLVHSGPILKFDIYIPFSQSRDMDLWILIMSRNGVKKLTLDNEYSEPYKLPSYIFSCTELTNLDLHNCIILDPPLDFGGFGNLSQLALNRVSLSPNIGTLIFSLPVLKILMLAYCTGVENIKILAPKLSGFGMLSPELFQWQCFDQKSNLRTVHIILGKKVKQRKVFNLMRLLANLPRIIHLWLDGFSLKFLSAGTVSNCNRIKVVKLTHLRFWAFGFNDLDQISCSLSLLRSSPNLQVLEIQASQLNNETMEPALNFMEAADHLDEILNKLQTVKLSDLNGLRTELLFIKLLLAHSPLLKRMVIGCRSGIDPKEELRILKEVMQFPRASTIAQIIFT